MSGVPLTPVERFLLAHLLYEYGGRLYFTTEKETPEETLAGFLAEDFVSIEDRRYLKVKRAFTEALKKLKENWMIELSGFEVALTVVGRTEAEKLSREHYEKLREKFGRT